MTTYGTTSIFLKLVVVRPSKYDCFRKGKKLGTLSHRYPYMFLEKLALDT